MRTHIRNPLFPKCGGLQAGIEFGNEETHPPAEPPFLCHYIRSKVNGKGGGHIFTWRVLAASVPQSNFSPLTL